MQLTPWGQRIEKRLTELGKDWKWICRAMGLRGIRYSMDELMHLMCEETQSKGRKNAIEKVLRDEELRQKYRKKVGFKGEGVCHTRDERLSNLENS